MKLRDIMQDALGKVVANILWYVLTACATLFVSIGAAFLNSLAQTNVTAKIVYALISACGLAGVILTIRLIVRRRVLRHRPKFPRIEYDYMFLDFTFELNFLSRRTVELTSYCKLKALKEVREYYRRYFWSGTGNESPIFIDNPHMHRISDQEDYGPGNRYKVVFGSPLYPGDETDFNVKIRCYDEKCRMSPHHGFTVLKPMEKLTLKLIMSDDLVSTVNRGVYTDSTAETPLDKIVPVSPRLEGGLRIYEWVINKPSLLYYYRLDWTFKD